MYRLVSSMKRTVAVIVALVVLAGSVPAAAALADTQTESDAPAPGASFAGVVGVQQAEVDNEVADRALSQRFAAAESNDSKARVVADQHQQLSERLDALEAEKERITRAYENGSMSRGEYQARLAALGAELRALENRANRTAEAAESLPEEALRSNGANVSEVRALAQQANRTGGGAVAEAAREIAGNGAGEGLRGPPNASERGPPDEAGESPEGPEGNESGQSAGPGNGAGAADGQQNETTGAPGDDTDRGNDADAPGQNDADGTETTGQQGNTTDSGARGGQGGNGTADGTAPEQPDGTGADGDSNSGDGNSSDDRQATDGAETESA